MAKVTETEHGLFIEMNDNETYVSQGNVTLILKDAIGLTEEKISEYFDEYDEKHRN